MSFLSEIDGIIKSTKYSAKHTTLYDISLKVLDATEGNKMLSMTEILALIDELHKEYDLDEYKEK